MKAGHHHPYYFLLGRNILFLTVKELVRKHLTYLGRRTDAAIKYGKNALRIAEIIESSFGEATSLITLGTIELARGHQPKAVLFAQRALAITRLVLPARHKLHRAASELCAVLSNTPDEGNSRSAHLKEAF